jgi:hypothetical protein
MHRIRYRFGFVLTLIVANIRPSTARRARAARR